MKIKPEHLEQLEKEIQHIFDSGANEIRVYEMVQTFIERRGQTLFIPIVVECKHDFEPYYNWCSELAGYRCEKCGKEKDG